MATLNEIAYDIASDLGKNTDHGYINRVKFNVLYYRALIMRRDYSRLHSFDEQYIQDLGCVEIEKADAAECCDVTLNCPVYRTKLEVPIPVRIKGAPFRYVGAIGRGRIFQYIQPEELVYLQHLRYTAKTDRYAYLNDRVYIFNKAPNKQINIRGVFEDPRVVAKFTTCEGEPCYSDNNNFPIPMDILESIRNGIVQGKMKLLVVDDEKEVETNEQRK